jgi:hypothetical protein
MPIPMNEISSSFHSTPDARMSFVLAALRLGGADRERALDLAKSLGMPLGEAAYSVMLRMPADLDLVKSAFAALAKAGVDMANAKTPHGIPLLAIAALTRSDRAAEALIALGADPLEEFVSERVPKPGRALGGNEIKTALQSAVREISMESSEETGWISTGGARLDALACAAISGQGAVVRAAIEKEKAGGQPDWGHDRWTRAAVFATAGLRAQDNEREKWGVVEALMDLGVEFSATKATLPLYDRRDEGGRADAEPKAMPPAGHALLGSLAAERQPGLRRALMQELAKKIPWATSQQDEAGCFPVEILLRKMASRFSPEGVGVELFEQIDASGALEPGQPSSEPALLASLDFWRQSASHPAWEKTPTLALLEKWGKAGAILSEAGEAAALSTLASFCEALSQKAQRKTNDSSEKVGLRCSLEGAARVGALLFALASPSARPALLKFSDSAQQAAEALRATKEQEAMSRVEALAIEMALQADRLLRLKTNNAADAAHVRSPLRV